MRLVDLAPDHAGFKRTLAWFEARIAELDGGSASSVADKSEKPRGGLFSRLLGR
jgi:hypothetical protein